MAVLNLIFSRWQRSTWVCSLSLLLNLPLSLGVSHAQPAEEYQIKAVFLFNFTQFIEWPNSTFPKDDTPLIIGILGKDPFGSYLDETIRNEKVKDHPLVVHRFRTVEEISLCHILFINIHERDNLKAIFKALNAKNILTVGEVTNFARYGGMIRFYKANDKIRIRINVEAVKSTDLVISSKLLRLAELVGTQSN